MKPQEKKNTVEAVDQPEGDHTPRNLSFAENVALTAKVLAGAGVDILVLWALNKWTTA
jgi:hypothetical protein